MSNGDGVRGSMSLSKMAEDDECLDDHQYALRRARGNFQLTQRLAMRVLMQATLCLLDVCGGAAMCVLKAYYPLARLLSSYLK